MKNTKFILKIFYKILLYGFALIGFAFIATMAFFYFDSAGNCLDAGGVWDEDQKICRYDCDKWKKGKGCIVFDKIDDKK